MKTVEIYDPAMCCSTGVCGPSPDDALIAFASSLKQVEAQGVSVKRYNLSQEPLAFAQNPIVKATLEDAGEAGLPLIFIDGELAFRGEYPKLSQMCDALGLASSQGCCEDESDCCSQADEKPAVAFVKVDGPKLSKTSSCDPSSGCC